MNRTQPFLAATVLATNLLLAQGPSASVSTQPELASMTHAEEQSGATQLGQRVPKLRTPIHTAEPDSGVAYGTWAAGDDYKASFHDGMTFIPYLGADYPVTQSLSWKTTSVKMGARELLANPAVPVARGSWRFEYQFGAVTEAYDVRHEGLEQTFVLTRKPAQGDLVIRGEVTTGLHAANAVAARQSLTFYDDAQRAIIEYGKALAFDDAGNRCDITTAYSNGEITLTVPASWMEHAVLPITVDPLLTPVSLTVGTGAPQQVDIGRDDRATTNNVLTTYSRAVSATDSDVWSYLSNDDFQSLSLVFSDVTSTWKTDETSCAFVGGASRWVIVVRRYFMNGTVRSSRLRCHVFDSGDTAFQTGYGSLNTGLRWNDWRPDTGGVQAFMSGDDAMVVFQREDNASNNNHFANADYSKVYGCLLDATTVNGTFGTPFEVLPTINHDCERPSVNQVARGGASFSWVCLQQRYVEGFAGEDWDLAGRRIGNDGTVALGTWVCEQYGSSPAIHQLGAKVEGSDGRYAVVYSTVDVASVNFKTSLIGGKRLRVQRFDWPHGWSWPSGSFASSTLVYFNDRRWEAMSIGFDTNDASHWACAFRSAPPGTGKLYYARLGYNGNLTEGGASIYSAAGGEAVAAACVFNNDADTFLFGYGVEEAAQTNPVWGHTLTYDAAPSPSTFGVSCGTANLSWDGSQQIGAEFGKVVVNGAPPAAIHVMLAATVTTNVPVLHPIVFPGCQLFVMAAGPGYLGAFPTAVGSNAEWQLPLPEFLGAQTLHFQDWYLDMNGLLYSRERLSVPIVK